MTMRRVAVTTHRDVEQAWPEIKQQLLDEIDLGIAKWDRRLDEATGQPKPGRGRRPAFSPTTYSVATCEAVLGALRSERWVLEKTEVAVVEAAQAVAP